MARREVDVAWAAGLYEGEGSASISGGRARVALQMTDEDVVGRFQAIVGRGNVRAYRAYQPRRKPQWQWSVQSAADVLHVLNLLWPYLCDRRRDQAMLVIERAAKINEHAGFCKRGHDLTSPEHVYVHRKTGKRHCGTCRREYMRRWRPRLAD